MKIFETKAGELTGLQIMFLALLASSVALVLFSVLKMALTTKNIVELPNGRKFVATSWFGPLSTSQYDTYAGAKVKALDAATKKDAAKV